ncbi:MAG: FAD-binding protein [Clostridia bacterium]|nr:FAD-binding protein [Clostridia bacterium]
MKIVFIGAGNAALVASERLARGGVECEVFEKNAYENLSYDWHDDINPDAWEAYGLPAPKEGTHFTKRNWTFIPPSESSETTLNLPEDVLDWSTERRLLAQQYADRAKDVVNFHFETPVDSLIIEDGKVKGVVVKGEKVYADLVVDNSGALSKFRASLPKEWKITPEPDGTEIFVAYRAFHKKATGVEEPKSTNRAYLKHLGEDGISWSILDPAGTVNVLIGRQGKLSKETFKRAYQALKASNPIIGDEVVRGGIECIIPIRFPLLRMVGDGYVAIGDSAFMTIPMIGSGIENSMKAGVELADVILKKQSVKKEDLWEYEVTYFEKRGAEHLGVDILKRWLLGAKPADIDWLFGKKVVDEKNMADAATGHLIILSFGDLLVKATRGITRLPLLLKMAGMLSKTKKVARLGRNIPKVYDEKAIDAWAHKVEKLIYG